MHTAVAKCHYHNSCSIWCGFNREAPWSSGRTLALDAAHCLSDETVKAVRPFYLVSMPGEVKDPTQGVNV